VSERLLGIETEYAIIGVTPSGASLDRPMLVTRVVDLARKRLCHLPDSGGHGLFIGNGSRFYIDSGWHPELSTPECSNPWDVTRYTLAGEHILDGLIQEVEKEYADGTRVLCFRCNVDYSGANTTWGCHESYLHRAKPAVFPAQIIPHLVSRVIYTGAGGFNSLSSGLEFTVSPRAPHLEKEISNDSTCNRGIFHTKDESLSGKGYHRLHILCGESLSSQIGTFLKLSTTALVVCMIEAGLRPGETVRLRSPLQAMRAIASDSKCKVLVELANGQWKSGISIQRHYLTKAEDHLHDSFMPVWASAACTRWRAMLDLLEEKGPTSAACTLDWAIKHALYTHQASRRGFTQDSISGWNRIVTRLRDALQRTPYRGKPVSVDLLLGASSPIRNEVERLTPSLRAHGLTWDLLNDFLMLRQELFEIDMKFGQLGDQSIFTALDLGGALSHHMPGVDRIEDAVTAPPFNGRARLRGEIIHRLSGNNGRYLCDWQAIWDQVEHRVLDLSDPFSTEERWRNLSPANQQTLLFELFRRRFPSSRVRSMDRPNEDPQL